MGALRFLARVGCRLRLRLCGLSAGRLPSFHFSIASFLLGRSGVIKSEQVILDIDPTDAETHGAQQLSFFHGYYDQHMYHPLLIFDVEGQLVSAVLRPGMCFRPLYCSIAVVFARCTW